MEEILPRLWLSDSLDGWAASRSGSHYVINVADMEMNRLADINIPMVKMWRADDEVMVPRITLEIVVHAIHCACTMQPLPVLVHCQAGIERSPLAVTAYVAMMRGVTMAEAFAIVAAKRPQVSNCLDWVK